MKWVAVPLAWLAAVLGFIITVESAWYLGVGFFVIAWGLLRGLGLLIARCPRCGQVWQSRMTLVTFAPWAPILDRTAVEDEIESLVCRRCYLDIGMGLRESNGPSGLAQPQQ